MPKPDRPTITVTGIRPTLVDLVSSAYSEPAGGGFPLDSYSADLAVAYSVRRLLTAYEGDCMRVRRSSDNTEQDIGFDVDGDLDTSALLTFVGAGDGFVVTWYDQSGNGWNATESTAASQLRIVASGVLDAAGSRGALTVATAPQGLTTSASVSQTQPYDLYVVAQETSGTSNRRIIGSTPFLWGTSGGVWAWHTGATLNGSAGSRDTSRHLFTGIADSPTCILREDGVQIASGDAGSASMDQFAILRDIGGGTAAQPGALVQEIIVLGGDQSANRATIEADMATYFGITFP